MSFIESSTLAATFALNSYAKAGAAMCERAFVFKRIKVDRLHEVISLPNLSNPTYDPFEIDNSSEPNAISTLFKSVTEALKKDKALYTTIRRYNASLARTVIEDKLIDITICLESIFSAKTEVSFRFALYNSLLAESNLENRYEVFELLKKLYDERSNIVHGSDKKPSFSWIETNWNHIITIAKIALLRRIEFLQNNEKKDWPKYLDKLSLGI